MMEENNDIFLAGGDALVYLTGPMHKKYSTIFHDCRVVPKNSFEHNHNRIYVLNNMMQMLQVNKNSNIKYNTSKIKIRRHTKLS